MATVAERIEALERVASDFREWRSGFMVDHEMLKDGVANFKLFKERGNKFFDSAEAVWEADEKRRTRHLTIAGIAALFVVPLAIWGGAKIVKAGVTIYKIEEQWQLAHPSEFKQQKSLYDAPAQVYAVDKAPQDAGNSPTYTAQMR